MGNFRDKLIGKFADEACESICQKVIKALQASRDTNLSGDDSGLENTWEEICVQVQGSRSFDWNTYEYTTLQFICTEVAKISPTYAQAIWLQTHNGFDWAYDVDTPDDPDEDNIRNVTDDSIPPADDDDIAKYILGEYVIRVASEQENAKIRGYLYKDAQLD